MSGVFRTIFGGPSKSKSSSESQSTSTSGNLAFPMVSSAVSPALGYLGSSGNMISALLGLSGPMAPANTAVKAPLGTPGNPVYSGSPAAVSSAPEYATDREQPYRTGGTGNRPGLFNHSNPPNPATPYSPYTPTGDLLPDPDTTTEAGPSPLDALTNFANSAGMQFVRDQGTKAIEGSAAGRGMLQSGATGKGLVEFGQQLGQTYLNQYMQNLFGLAGLGNDAMKNLALTGEFSNSQSTGESSGKAEGAKKGILGDIAKIAAAAA